MQSRPMPVERFRIDQLEVEICADRGDLGAAAAHDVADCIRESIEAQGYARIVFASAPSQNEFLKELGAISDIDWGRITAFHMDEYVGLAPDAPQSFVRYLNEHLFNRVIPAAAHFLDGLAPDPQAECRRYAELLTQAPIDIVCAGIGENGHLAFNDPPDADFKDPHMVKVVQLAQRSREQQVHDGCFDRLEDVPRLALTLTIPALMAARHIHTMVPGPTKAEAIREALLGPVGVTCPATILRQHGASVLYTDMESSALYRQARAQRP